MSTNGPLGTERPLLGTFPPPHVLTDTWQRCWASWTGLVDRTAAQAFPWCSTPTAGSRSSLDSPNAHHLSSLPRPGPVLQQDLFSSSLLGNGPPCPVARLPLALPPPPDASPLFAYTRTPSLPSLQLKIPRPQPSASVSGAWGANTGCNSPGIAAFSCGAARRRRANQVSTNSCSIKDPQERKQTLTLFAHPAQGPSKGAVVVVQRTTGAIHPPCGPYHHPICKEPHHPGTCNTGPIPNGIPRRLMSWQFSRDVPSCLHAGSLASMGDFVLILDASHFPPNLICCLSSCAGPPRVRISVVCTYDSPLLETAVRAGTCNSCPKQSEQMGGVGAAVQW